MYKVLKNIFFEKKVALFIFFLINILLSFISILYPYISGKYIDYLVLNFSTKKILYLIFIYFLLRFIKVFLSWLCNILSLKLKSRISFKIINKFINIMYDVPLKKFQDYDSVYLSQRINSDSNNITEFILTDVYQFFISIVNIIVISAILTYINFKITFILLISLIIYIFLYTKFKNSINKYSYEYFENQNKYSYSLSEPFKFSKYIKIHSFNNIFESRVYNSFKSFQDSLLSYGKLTYIYGSLEELTSLIFSTIIMIICYFEFSKQHISLGDITITLNYFYAVLSSLGYILTFGQTYQENKVSYNRLKDLFNLDKDICGFRKLSSINDIVLNNVSYYDNNHFVLNNFNYHFTKGNIYNIQGFNGSGKSTFLYLITKIINNTSGAILFNDINVTELDMKFLRSKLISFLEQDSMLVTDTIYNNLTYNIDDTSFLNHYVDMFDLRSCINKFEDNIYTNIKDNLENISGGEKQKISLIRTFLKNSDVIILDEPTSALDIKSIDTLKEHLHTIKSNKIIIIVSHGDDFKSISDFNITLK